MNKYSNDNKEVNMDFEVSEQNIVDFEKIERIKKYFYFQQNLGDSCKYNSNLSLGGS